MSAQARKAEDCAVGSICALSAELAVVEIQAEEHEDESLDFANSRFLRSGSLSTSTLTLDVASLLATPAREIAFHRETDSLMKLCDTCKILDISTGHSQHQPSYSALVKSVLNGCDLCKLFLQVMLEAHSNVYKGFDTQDAHRCFLSTDSPCTVEFPPTACPDKLFFSTQHKCYGYPRSVRTDINDEDYEYGGRMAFDVRAVVPEGKEEFTWESSALSRPQQGEISESLNDAIHCHDFGHRRYEEDYGGGGFGVPPEITPYPNFNLARRWIRNCFEKHLKCVTHTQADAKGCPHPLLPTRILDVGPDDGSKEPRLIISKGRRAQYITLSHCWGKSQPLVTNTATLQQHLDGIPLASFPNTFRDALIATRKLGYSFLWIDSLCIIQDSGEDWQAECSRMADIYRNSAVTVVGAAASNCHAGFLHERIPTQPRSDVWECKNTEGKNSLKREIAIRQEKCERPRPCDQASPLEKRGWILQERLLSPRVLYFGAHRMYWNCNTSEWFEDGALTKPRPRSKKWTKGRLSLEGWNVEDDPKYKWNPWYTIVEEYSSLSLTNPMDKLPALSGIANWFLNGCSEEYLAGLIKDDLYISLGWHVDIKPLKSRREPETQGNSNLSICTYRAPSWSWASIDRTISFFGTGRGDCPRKVPSSTLVLLEAHVKKAGKDTFGQVDVAYLKVEGKMKIGIIHKHAERRQYVLAGCPTDFYPDDPEWWNILGPQSTNARQLICLCVLERGGGFLGLALKQLGPDSDGWEQFQRVGCFWFPPSTNPGDTMPWFGDVPRQQIKLV